MSTITEIKNYIINKEFKKAIPLLLSILLKNPNNIEANFLLAVIYEKKKDYQLSINQYKITNNLKEGSLIYNRIANLYTKLQNYSLAIENYKKSLNIDATIAETHNNYGLLLVLKNKENKSLYHFSKAIELKNNYIDPKYNFLEISEKTNKLNSLNNYINKLINEYPNDRIFKFYKAVNLENKKLYVKAKEELENIFFDNSEKKWEIRKLNLLGFIYQNLKDYKNSFIYFQKCNNFLIQNYCLNLYKQDKYLKKISNYIINSKKYPKTKYKKIDNSENFNLFFLVGFPRSGTTLLDNILNSHKDIRVIEEKPMLYNSLKNLPEKEQIDIEYYNIKKVRKNYLSELKKNMSIFSAKEKKIIIDKMPLNLIYARNIYKIFPDAKIIFCLRHPLDCVLSCYIQNFTINEAMINFLNLKKTATLYNKSFELLNKYSEIPKEFIHYIKYENLIENFKLEVSEVLKFLNIDFDEKILNFYLNSKDKERIRTASYKQVVQPIYSESKLKWKKYKKQLDCVVPMVEKWIEFYKY